MAVHDGRAPPLSCPPVHRVPQPVWGGATVYIDTVVLLAAWREAIWMLAVTVPRRHRVGIPMCGDVIARPRVVSL